VVKRRVEIVDTNRVYTQLLHEGCISQTFVAICERIFAVCGIVCSLTSGLVIDTNDHYPLVGGGVDEVLATDLDWLDGIGDG